MHRENVAEGGEHDEWMWDAKIISPGWSRAYGRGERECRREAPLQSSLMAGKFPEGFLQKKPLAAVYSPRGVFQFPVRTFHLLQSEFTRPEKGAVFVACNVWMRQGRKGHFGSTFNLKWLHSNASAIAPSRRAQKRWTDAYGRFQRMFFCG